MRNNKIGEKQNILRERFKVSFDPGIPGEPVKVIFENEDITSIIRTEDMAKITSTLASSAASEFVSCANVGDQPKATPPVISATLMRFGLNCFIKQVSHSVRFVVFLLFL